MSWRLGLGLALVGALAAAALLSLAWTPQPPARLHIPFALRPPFAPDLPPGLGLLGTDNFGRDVLSMLMAGAANSLGIAAPSVLIGGALGTALGVAAAGRGGWLDGAAMRLCDAVFAVPPVLSALLLATALGPGRATAVAAIALFLVPVFARVARGGAQRAWASDYVLAARALGKSGPAIAFGNVLPNIAGLLAVQGSTQLGLAVLTEAGLGYLGLGAPPPAPSWGHMLADAGTFAGRAPWLAVAPGAAVALAVLGFNLVGDGLRDRLDRSAAPP